MDKTVNAAAGSFNTVTVDSHASVEGSGAYPVPWRMSGGQSWVKIGRDRESATVLSGDFDGSGREILYIVCDENEGAQRDATFTVLSKYYTGCSKTETFRVVQAAASARETDTSYTIVSTSKPEVAYDKTSAQVKVDYTWTDFYKNDDEQISTGSNSRYITATFEANDTYQESYVSGTTQNVEFTGGLYNKTKPVDWTVKRGAKPSPQEPEPEPGQVTYTYDYFMEISPVSTTLTYDQPSRQITVSAIKRKYADGVYQSGEDSNAAWTATVANQNVTLSSSTGSGTGTVTVSASDFTSSASDTITFTCDDDPNVYCTCSITISQQPNHYLVSGPSSGIYSMYITSPSTDYSGNTITTQGSAYFNSGTRVQGYIEINNNQGGHYFASASEAGVSPSGAATLTKTSNSRIDFDIASLTSDVTFTPSASTPSVNQYTITNNVEHTLMNNSVSTTTSVNEGDSVTLTTESTRYKFITAPTVTASGGVTPTVTISADKYTCTISNIQSSCTITGSVEYQTQNYTVTNNVTNASINLTNNQVVEGGYFYIYPNEGYYFTSVGDVTISSGTAERSQNLTAGGFIQITNVTSDITISGAATQKTYNYTFDSNSPASRAFSFGKDGGNGTITMTSKKVSISDPTDAHGLIVSYSSNESWCTVGTPSLSQGVSTCAITCSAVSQQQEGTRTATITATQEETNQTKTFTVTQSKEGYYIVVSKNSGTVPVPSGGGTITLSAIVLGNSSHSALSGGGTRINTPSNVGGWWRVTNVTHQNNNTTEVYTIQVDSTSGSARQDTITFTSPEADISSGSYTISQNGAISYSLSLSVNNVDVGYTGGEVNIAGYIYSNSPSGTSISYDMLHPETGFSLSGSTVTVSQNNSYDPRSCTVRVYQDVTDGAYDDIIISQSGKPTSSSTRYFSVSNSGGYANGFTFGSSGGSDSASITCHTTVTNLQTGNSSDTALPWSASASESYATVSPSSGNGDGTITISVGPYNGNTDRTFYVTISQGTAGDTQTIYCTQTAPTPVSTTYTISVDDSGIPYGGAGESYTAGSGNPSTISSDATGVTLTFTAEEGYGWDASNISISGVDSIDYSISVSGNVLTIELSSPTGNVTIDFGQFGLVTVE